jgi:hypothetical protein
MRCATCNADLEKEECSHIRGDVRVPSSGALAQIRQQLLVQPQDSRVEFRLTPVATSRRNGRIDWIKKRMVPTKKNAIPSKLPLTIHM